MVLKVCLSGSRTGGGGSGSPEKRLNVGWFLEAIVWQSSSSLGAESAVCCSKYRSKVGDLHMIEIR